MIRNVRLTLILALCGCAALAIALASLAFVSYVQILHFIPTTAVAGVAITGGTFSILVVLTERMKPRSGSLGRPVVLVGVAALAGFLVGAFNLLFPSWLILPVAFAFTATVIALALPPGRVIKPRRGGLLALGASAFLLTPSLLSVSTLLSGFYTNPAVLRGLYGTVFIGATFGTLYAIALAAIFVGQLRPVAPVRASPAAS